MPTPACCSTSTHGTAPSRPAVKVLVDESLSARVARLLVVAGHDALHVGDIGLLGALDEAVMEAAQTEDRVLVAADTDFGELLAIGAYSKPSVVLVRRSPHAVEDRSSFFCGASTRSARNSRAGPSSC